jgi:hypothetical protein
MDIKGDRDKLKQFLLFWKNEELSEDRKFWITVGILVMLPALLAYVAIGIFLFSSYILTGFLKVAIFTVLLGLVGIVFAAIPVAAIWAISKTFRAMRKGGFDDTLSISLPLLTVMLGVDLGAWLRASEFHIFFIISTIAIALPLTVLLIYPPLQRARQIAKYRQSEQHLNDP